jgi:hypothetical protein
VGDGDTVPPELAALRELLDAGAEPLARATAASRALAQLTAVVATSLAEFAGARPAAQLDRQPGQTGAMSAATRAARPEVLKQVSEWAVDEVAAALSITANAAQAQLVDSLVLDQRLPATRALMAAGELSPAHTRQLINIVGPVADDALRADIEAHVLRLRGRKTPPQLGDCARRIVLRKDADAAGRKLLAAVRERGVRLYDRRDGTGTVAIDLPLPTAAAIYRALEAYADTARGEGDERTKQQRMADCLADLILRPGESGTPPVTVALTLVATLETMLGGAEPGQVEGMLVPAEMVRELAYTFGLLPRPAPDLTDLPDEPAPELVPETQVEPAPEAGTHLEPPSNESSSPDPDREPTPVDDRTLSEWMALAAARHAAAVRAGLGGAKQAILDGVWSDGELRGLLDLGALIDVHRLAGTGLSHRPQIAIVDALRGSLLALTDAGGLRRGQGLGPPPATPGYSPGAELDRFVRLRDRRCRFPGCRRRARVCDLDHRTAWPHGSTSHTNLCCLCEHHHRLKHQAPGWTFTDGDDGTLVITTPSGQVLTSHPPRFGTDFDIPPY